MGKKVYIVVEETGERDANGNQPFNIYLEGVKPEELNNVPMEKWRTADFWGFKLFQICKNAVLQAGAAAPRKDVN
jgi:hypothetical protein